MHYLSPRATGHRALERDRSVRLASPVAEGELVVALPRIRRYIALVAAQPFAAERYAVSARYGNWIHRVTCASCQ